MGRYKSHYTGEEIDDLLSIVEQYGSGNTIMWEGAKFMNGDSAVAFDYGKEEGEFHKVSEQQNGIVLVFSLYDTGTGAAQDASWSCHFVPKSMIGEDGLDNAGSHTFLMATFTDTIDIFGVKHLTISDTRIEGYIRNGMTSNEYGVSDCGIKFSNKNYVLRYVIGV